jgi:acetyl esterase/lipase
VVIGHSSGAWAAAMLALDARWLERAGVESVALAGVIGLAGPYAVTALIDRADAAVFAGSGPEMEPVNLHPARHPPLLLLTGSADTDVRPAATPARAEQARELGSEARARVYAGLGHDEILRAASFPFPRWSAVSDDIGRFVRGARSN